MEILWQTARKRFEINLIHKQFKSQMSDNCQQHSNFQERRCPLKQPAERGPFWSHHFRWLSIFDQAPDLSY